MNSKSRKIGMPETYSSDKEKTILDAARKRFAYYGFTKVTMDEIAADVSMGKASLYYYFPTKESLFQAVIGREQHRLVVELEGIIAQEKPASQKLDEYLRARLLYFREFVNLSALGFQRLGEAKALFRDMFATFERTELRLLQEIVQAGGKSGEFAVSSPQRVAELLLHIVVGLRLRALRLVEGPRIDDRTFADLEQERKLLVDVLLYGITRRNS